MTKEQRNVAKGALPALITFVIALCSTYYLANQGVSLHMELPTALGILMLPFIYCIGRIANKRFLDESAIAGSAYDSPDSNLAVEKAVLQNTLEQTVLAFGAYTLLAYILPTIYTALLPTLVLLFITGRVFFIAGYKQGAGGRAFGFGLTFYPTTLMLIGSLIYLLFS